MEVVEEIINRAHIDDKIILKLIFKASGTSYFNGKENYILDDVATQKKMIEKQLSKGIDLEVFSFEELNIENNHI